MHTSLQYIQDTLVDAAKAGIERLQKENKELKLENQELQLEIRELIAKNNRLIDRILENKKD